MAYVTVLLAGRRLHLVRRAAECELCENHTAHVVVQPRDLPVLELANAVLRSAADPGEIRSLAAMDGTLHNMHRLLDTAVADKIAWLLQTGRLTAVECRRVAVSQGITPRPAEPFVPLHAPVTPSQLGRQETPEKTWVEIVLLDDKGKPVAGEQYLIKTPDGVERSGVLDADGRARVSDIDPGSCDISFPAIDGREWKAV